MDVTDDEDEDADEGKTGVEDIGVEDVQQDPWRSDSRPRQDGDF